ncbi:hypothetical protein GGS20DRAFT_550674 [Poronia punctata]|nr:hypothetical protein GGS20DRAFT_550674 [Poronia punctata]
MGKPNNKQGAPLHTLPPRSSAGGSSYNPIPIDDDDIPEVAYDDLPPSYDDVPATDPTPFPTAINNPNPVRPQDPDSLVVTDKVWGIQSWVAKSIEEPECLERYIHQLATVPPRPYMRVSGTHRESGRERSTSNSRDRIITDFDVSLDITPYLFADARYGRSWSAFRTVENGEKVHRGTTLRKRAPHSTGTTAPDFIPDEEMLLEAGEVDNKPGLREWCHRFAASHSPLKCFTFRRVVTGFDEDGLSRRLHELVRRLNYRGRVVVNLVVKDDTVHCYNDTTINRWRLTNWIRWLFYLSFLWLLSWPYLFFRTKKWEVVLTEWAFSRTTTQHQYGRSKEYVSVTEEQLYNMWAPAFARAVMEKRVVILDQADLRRAHEGDLAFDTTTVDGRVIQASIGAMNEVNRRLGWGEDG